MFQDEAPLRVVLSFLKDVDAMSVVPPLLQQYAKKYQLELSNLQILDFVDKGVLELVIKEIKKRTGVHRLVMRVHTYAYAWECIQSRVTCDMTHTQCGS